MKCPTCGVPQPVALWQSRYVGDPRQKGMWDTSHNHAWCEAVYSNAEDHILNGWEVRPLYAAGDK